MVHNYTEDMNYCRLFTRRFTYIDLSRNPRSLRILEDHGFNIDKVSHMSNVGYPCTIYTIIIKRSQVKTFYDAMDLLATEIIASGEYPEYERLCALMFTDEPVESLLP